MESSQAKQILFLILLFLAFILIFAILIYSSVAEARTMDVYETGKKKLIHYHNGELEITDEEVIEADIVAEKSNVVIEGTLYGDIVAIKSVVALQAGAKIFGHVISYESEVTIDSSAQIAGEVLQIAQDSVASAGGRTLLGYGFELHVFENDAIIADTENVAGDIVALHCSLELRGHVAGDVYHFFGRTAVDSSAAIDGHLVNYLGEMDIADESLVTGNILHISDQEEVVSTDELEEETELKNRIEQRYLSGNEKGDVVRFWGDVTIEQGEVIDGDVVTINGTIEVKGKVRGDVVAVFGSVDLDSTAEVSGDVVSVGGDVHRHKEAIIRGDIVQTNLTGVKVAQKDEQVEIGKGGVSVCTRRQHKGKERRSRRRHYRR